MGCAGGGLFCGRRAAASPPAPVEGPHETLARRPDQRLYRGMDVVFLQPNYPAEMPEFTRGLAEVGARVYGIGDTAEGALSPQVRRYLSGYLQVPRLLDDADVADRASAWLRGRNVDQVQSCWEPLVLSAAVLRERWGVPGMGVDTVRGFRDKKLMKERVEAAGLRTPRSARVRTVAEGRAAAEELGYPLCLKPIAGAGSADTYRVGDAAELEATLARMRGVPEAIAEEFIEGDEFTYDTVSIGGVPAYDNVVQYMPKPIIARNQEWVSPAQVSVKDLTQPSMAAGRALGRGVLQALGMQDGFTHMEWFLTPQGEAVFGEIACRPGGAKLVDQMNWTSEIDVYREWARAVCYGHFEAPTERLHNTSVIFKRAIGQGRVQRIEGLGDFLRAHGEHVIEECLFRPGTPRRDWKQTLMSDGHVAVKHSDWETICAITADAAAWIKLFAG